MLILWYPHWIRERINHQIRQCYFNDWRKKQRNIRRYETSHCCLLNECTFITRVIQILVRVEEYLIIRSWFVVLLLCDENKSYINLMHAENMSRSKPKKSLTLEFIHVQLMPFWRCLLIYTHTKHILANIFLSSSCNK